MKTVTEYLRARLLRPRSIYHDLMRTEWSPEFERYMRNRLFVGALRYGLMHDSSRRDHDLIGSIVKRAASYLQDGNQEHLVDIANCALLEFVRQCCHPKPHWSPTDDDARHHAKELK